MACSGEEEMKLNFSGMQKDELSARRWEFSVGCGLVVSYVSLWCRSGFRSWIEHRGKDPRFRADGKSRKKESKKKKKKINPSASLAQAGRLPETPGAEQCLRLSEPPSLKLDGVNGSPGTITVD